jgi:hypothetical protein
VVLCVSLEYRRSKKTGFLRCSAYLLNTTGLIPNRLLSGKFPSLQKSEHRRSNSLWNTPPLMSRRTPQEEPHFIALSAGATSHGNGTPDRSSCGLFPPRWSKVLYAKSSSQGKSRPKARVKRTRIDAILKKFN